MYGYGAPGVPMMPPTTQPGFPLEQPKDLFRYGEQTIWSTQLFSNGAVLANTTNRVFTTPLGQVGQGFGNALSISETNIKEGGRIPSGVAYDVFGVSCQYILSSNTADTGTLSTPVNGANIAGLQNVINNGVLSWDFTQTQVDISPLHLIGAGGGVYGSEAITSGSNATIDGGSQNNGNGAVWLYRVYPVALPGNSTFAIVARFGSRAAVVGAASIALRVTLLGYYKNIIEIG